ncbi:alpha/beta hydrolase [Rubrivivax albus]|uniref:Alpha/beta hydrolase n=2 Tax=Rubrivivax albus TaxID=2499835 RepID=A0A3S2X2X4_9BURK|nr:alpha/beta hydrolase [Rubrivivax albus]
MRGLPLRPADLRGLSRLGVQAVLGVTHIVEAMHHTVLSRPHPLGQRPAGRTGGITGFVYGAVRGTTRVVGAGLDGLLRVLPGGLAATGPRREAFVAALNGVVGDHLADSGNPLAIPMRLRIGGRPWRDALATTAATPSRRVLVLVHGLAMHDGQWHRRGHDHGQVLAQALGVTPVYLHYNSGRHVSQNGQDFRAALDDLVTNWPVPVDELMIVGHSMGGLVARSACHGAGRRPWRRRLSRLVFLGTPHHGAVLERGGRLVDAALGVSPYAAPLARLGQVRSAGITDLRYGNVQAADGQHRHRHDQTHDDRRPTPLPRGVACHVVAATTARAVAPRRGLHDALIGDGLVPLASALGEHADTALRLRFRPDRRMIITGANHFDLLSRADVAAQLQAWLR